MAKREKLNTGKLPAIRKAQIVQRSTIFIRIQTSIKQNPQETFQKNAEFLLPTKLTYYGQR